MGSKSMSMDHADLTAGLGGAFNGALQITAHRSGTYREGSVGLVAYNSVVESDIFQPPGKGDGFLTYRGTGNRKCVLIL